MNNIHPWEMIGLGVAPFKYVGYEYKTHQACPGAPVQVGGSCDACGTGIKHFCWIQDVNGKRFKVGDVCVGKVDKVLAKKVDRDIRKAKKAQADFRARARITAAGLLLASDVAVWTEIASHPHPSPWREKQGDTRLGYFRWMLKNAGLAGQLKVTRAIEKTAEALAI